MSIEQVSKTKRDSVGRCDVLIRGAVPFRFKNTGAYRHRVRLPRCFGTGRYRYPFYRYPIAGNFSRRAPRRARGRPLRGSSNLVVFFPSTRCLKCTGSRSNSPGYPVMVSSRRRPSRPRILSLSRVLRRTCAHQDWSRADNARVAYRSLLQSMPIQCISLPHSYSELVIVHLLLQRRISQMRFTMSGTAMHPHHSLD
jgi:hypothetical protein